MGYDLTLILARSGHRTRKPRAAWSRLEKKKDLKDAMNELNRYQKGDVIVHRRRPEWGHGVVDQVTAIKHDGRQAQRLVVRFVHHGRVTLNTAIAPVAPKGSPNRTPDPGSLLVAEEDQPRFRQEQDLKQLASLPEPMTDPFASLPSRLRATLDSYRFSAEPHHACNPRDPKRLIGWAISQTHTEDPLSHFTRQQLEQAYGRFARDRDAHLIQLVQLAKKQGHAAQLEHIAAQLRDSVARAALAAAMKR